MTYGGLFDQSIGALYQQTFVWVILAYIDKLPVVEVGEQAVQKVGH